MHHACNICQYIHDMNPDETSECTMLPPVVPPLLAKKKPGGRYNRGGTTRGSKKFSFGKQAKIFFSGFAAI